MTAPSLPDVLRRLREAQTLVKTSLAARERVRHARTARRAIEAASRHLAALDPVLGNDARALLEATAAACDREGTGDRWAVAREVTVLRSEGVQPHRIARAMIRVGICQGPEGPAKVRACLTQVRKERQRFRRSGA